MRGARDANSVDLARQIQEIAPKALENLRQIIEDETGEIPLHMKAKESNNLLDRAGYGAKTQSEHRHLHAHMTADDIEEIKRRARSCGVLAEETEAIDVSPKDEE
jgi:rubrerythrin